ncbi:MAG: patatin-like phospholipase family protein [Gammaproteobacteria bacterium]|nr:patatin-like phospholipase family protein [Gammaproteobacteria bacterium]
MSEDESRSSPYKGLPPFDVEDAQYFFGRERDSRLIAADLFAAPLTVLYGASGVGKSSVLRAGVVPLLAERTNLLIVLFSGWQSDPLPGFKRAVAEAIFSTLPLDDPDHLRYRDDISEIESQPLKEYLKKCAKIVGRRLMIILDQFEEYFLYHPQDDEFGRQFPAATAIGDVSVSFLLSMREEAVARLDRFEGRLPTLFDNYRRIDHLDGSAGRAAIEKPIEQYNRLHDSIYQPIKIEPGLVEAVLEQIKVGQVKLEQLSHGFTTGGTATVRIETPYLQLVMDRLWRAAMDDRPRDLRLDTFKRLGYAARIIRGHLEDATSNLTFQERGLASNIFRYLVTPSGSKIALTVGDLAYFTGIDESPIRTVLEKLCNSSARLLRPVAPLHSGQRDTGYEIFHDALAPAIRDWLLHQRTQQSGIFLSGSGARLSGIDVPDSSTPINGSYRVEPRGRVDTELGLEELRPLIIKLKAILEFDQARTLLEQARNRAPSDIWVTQQLAACTYKDDNLQPMNRFNEAIKILEDIGLSNPKNSNSKTLALGGAIFRQMWVFSGQLTYLYESIKFYRAAYERNPEMDVGYGGVNAAYLLDVLASHARVTEMRHGTSLKSSSELIQEAAILREHMVEHVPRSVEKQPRLKEEFWFVAVVAEIYFGLDNYAGAEVWLLRSKELHKKDQEVLSVFQQLTSIAKLHGLAMPDKSADRGSWHPGWRVLTHLLGEATERALFSSKGRVGLALSGMGLKAAFFHVGVLARLAEMDALRDIEVLSATSGGSIVGTYYYLELKSLLEAKDDSAIDQEDYVEIVRRVQQQFLAGVQTNLHAQAFAGARDNLRMVFTKYYSQIHRLGELFEEQLYSRVSDGHPVGQRRTLSSLLIRPKNEANEGTFNPRLSNWRRRSKIPMLLLNASSMNTGHNWQFTATWMGESPAMDEENVDSVPRYRRLYYAQAPEALKNYRLGYAVAASSCIPGLYEPLAIPGLYPDRIVRLVDGNLHSSKGVHELITNSCNWIIWSDASPVTLDEQPIPSNSIIGVLIRSTQIMADRARRMLYQDILGRSDEMLLDGIAFLPLSDPGRSDGNESIVDWLGCGDPIPSEMHPSSTTPYGVDKDLQGRIADVRSGLDSFTEVEAYSLMLSGYLIAEHKFREQQKLHEAAGNTGTWGGYDVNAARGDWPFLTLEGLFGLPSDSLHPGRRDLAYQLGVARFDYIKVLKYEPVLSKIGGVGAMVLVVLFVVSMWLTWNDVFLTLGGLMYLLLLVIAVAAVPFLRKVPVALFGFVGAKIRLRYFDSIFLRRGCLHRLLSLSD